MTTRVEKLKELTYVLLFGVVEETNHCPEGT